MSHRDSVRLRHMLDHAREAVAMAAGKTRDDLDLDRKLNLALVRLLEIVGEAAGKTTDEDRQKCPQSPGAQSLACAIASSTDTTRSISMFFGRSSRSICSD